MQGTIGSYVHHNGRIAALVSLSCETDFVARTREFKDLAHLLARQVAATNPANRGELLAQPNILDGTPISEAIENAIKTFKEKIDVGFCYMTLDVEK